jgi:hypothetical protein
VAGGTNVVASKAAGTNAAGKVARGMTNEIGAVAPVSSPLVVEQGSNGAVVIKGGGVSNSVARVEPVDVATDSTVLATNQSATNVVAQTEANTNAAPMNPSLIDTSQIAAVTVAAMGTSNFSVPSMPTNARPITLTARTNVRGSGTNMETNAALLAGQKRGTNSPRLSQMAMAGMNTGGPPGMRGGAPAPELAPEVKARVNRIYESELLGQIMHPQPMALLGIAGNTAFLRSPSGQTGLVKEGDSLGEIKLVRIGVNRVLVEQDGQKKELIIFEGYGSKSLLEEKNENAH